MSRTPVSRALLSVSDKRGIVDLAKRLAAAGVEIVSTGGTARTLTEAGVDVVAVSDVTGSPEILDGRVKTLHPVIHGGILARHDDPGHVAELAMHDISPIGLVVVNLYPFAETVARPDADDAEIVEQIDIGGPTMVRAAAKNHAHVAVVTSPDRYDEIAAAVEGGGITLEVRRELAAEAFAHTAAYDAAILTWFEGDDEMPGTFTVVYERAKELRYGENPHQSAALFRHAGATSWWDEARQLQGKAMSFNNYNDTEAAWRLVTDLPEPAVAVIKHANPAGAATAGSLAEAFRAAWDCDPLSAFGGIVACNRPLDAATATMLSEYFVEVVIAPALDDEAADILAARTNLRVLVAPPPQRGGLEVRPLEGGALVQTRDVPDGLVTTPEAWTVVSRRAPTDAERENLRFAWIVAAHTKSNAIVVARDAAAIGVGAGDQSRVGAAQRALARAGERAAGAVAASDAFFPFRDGVDALAAAGVTAIIEPGGSRRDEEVIAAADEADLALVFTHRRHFRH
jgi:phosphoribosylaminoimidazolecarboxamide formyltransferase/IMP cyclohydrolase